MADEKPKPRAKRKKRRRAPRDEYVRCMGAIEDCDWDWSCVFGLDGRRDSLDPHGASPTLDHGHVAASSKPLDRGRRALAAADQETSTTTSERNHEPSGWRLPFKTTNTTFRALLRIASSVLASGFSRTAASRHKLPLNNY